MLDEQEKKLDELRNNFGFMYVNCLTQECNMTTPSGSSMMEKLLWATIYLLLFKLCNYLRFFLLSKLSIFFLCSLFKNTFWKDNNFVICGFQLVTYLSSSKLVINLCKMTIFISPSMLQNCKSFSFYKSYSFL